MDEGTYQVRAFRDRIRVLLDRERQRLHEEIRAYPTPIPRCDQQFNQLIDSRERVFEELLQLDNVTASGAVTKASAEGLLAFIDASRCLDDESKTRLKAAFLGLVESVQRLSAAESGPRGGQDRHTG